jgi:hypothetical protein
MGAINIEKKFLWVWIPKNAGSFFFSHPSICGSWHAKEGSHKTYKELSLIVRDDLDSYFKFAFVRNPYDKIVSAFHHFSKAHKFDIYKSFEDFILNNFEDDHGNIDIKNSKTFLSTYRRFGINGETHNDHFIPQIEYIIGDNNSIEMDFIGRFESLYVDFCFVCDSIGISKIKNQVKNKSTHDCYMKYFEGKNSRSKLDIVNFLYKEDFEKFKYEMY